MVGLGRIELPTSPLSGVRSSQLSYRPRLTAASPFTSRVHTGGAGRDRTGDLLNANQALSQLSYSPMPPIAVLKCAGREINRGQLDAETTGTSPWPLESNSSYLSGDRDGLTKLRRAWRFMEWNVCPLFAARCTLGAHCFHELHPRSLLERR